MAARKPRLRYRTVTGELGGYRRRHYGTEAACDAEGQWEADRLGESVLLEVWDESHPQDELNRGWACYGVADPKPLGN